MFLITYLNILSTKSEIFTLKTLENALSNDKIKRRII